MCFVVWKLSSLKEGSQLPMKSTMFCSVFVLVVLSSWGMSQANPCVPTTLPDESVVCVCNSTYCDTLDVDVPKQGDILILTSSKDGLRFHSTFSNVTKYASKGMEGISKRYQVIKGFGGALSDAAALNAMNLSVKARDKFVRSYFGSEGIEYSIVRVPMAACDYSTRNYTYLDTPNDFNLTTFSLAFEDRKWKIPLLKDIFAVSKRNVSLFGSPWTAPAWMKTNGEINGLGQLKGQAGDKYHKTWAQYFVKFFDAYAAEGIHFWGVTMQNEPSNGLLVPAKWQATGWWPEDQRDFIKYDLGPALKKSSHRNIKLMIHDDQRLFLLTWTKTVLSDPEAAQYVSGIGVHWYWNWLFGPEVLSKSHETFPDKFILGTEACNPDPPTTVFGSWEQGEKYSNDILDNLNNWAIGWVDWNMCLNFEGGPRWTNGSDSSPIIINGTGDEFYKQPMYYHLGHFSKFAIEGTVRVHSALKSNITNIKHTAMQRTDGYIVVVVLNKEDTDQTFQIDISSEPNESLSAVIPKRSVQTYVWKP